MAPVPVYVRGGVWTNVEDQILKAAIQKYGTHQWSKVSSLLQKKSARQCEIRWCEFLSPQLDFTQFSKDEDAKLLNLARRLPNQWRTISEMMGRTAQVCIERYNKLLSIHTTEGDGDEEDLKLGSSLDFKVGDLNPYADTQVAKPDNEELEDDEREMLAEAKARLLNTQGKKATRKIRERMLEESKRIAEIQKRRELKQAGISSGIKKGKKKYADEIDYNDDIVYEQAPLPGLYDTKEEDIKTQRELNKFEKLIERRGLQDKERKSNDKKSSSGKNKRSRADMEAQDKLKQTEKTKLKSDMHEFRDQTRSKLVLSKPGSKDGDNHSNDIAKKRQALLDSKDVGSVLTHKASQMVTVKRMGDGESHDRNKSKIEKQSRVKLMHTLLEMLPKPKNDFEIVLDTVEDDDDEIDTLTKSVQTNANDVIVIPTVQVDLDCLKDRALPIPDFIENPKNDFENMYNELLSNKLNGTAYSTKSTISDIKTLLELQLKNLWESQQPNSKISKPLISINSEEIVQSITEKSTEITSIQTQLKHIEPLIQQNHTLSRKLCDEQLPILRELQARYYVNYKIYHNELRGIKNRQADMQSYLNTLNRNPL